MIKSEKNGFWSRENLQTRHSLDYHLELYITKTGKDIKLHLMGRNGEVEENYRKVIRQLNVLSNIRGESPNETIEYMFSKQLTPPEITDFLMSSKLKFNQSYAFREHNKKKSSFSKLPQVYKWDF